MMLYLQIYFTDFGWPQDWFKREWMKYRDSVENVLILAATRVEANTKCHVTVHTRFKPQ
jgi:hypothetical protein